MKKVRRKIDAALKAKIALEALRKQSLRVPSRQAAFLRRWLGLELESMSAGEARTPRPLPV